MDMRSDFIALGEGLAPINAIRTSDPKDRRKVLFCATPKGAELALAERNERHAWLDRRLHTLSPEDESVIARACALLGEIAAS